MKQRTFQMVETRGIRLRVMVEGSGPLCVLVHGFPESWYSWRHQIDPLVAAGYRVAALDVRGYGGSDKPHAIEAYDMVEMTDDVLGVNETDTLSSVDDGLPQRPELYGHVQRSTRRTVGEHVCCEPFGRSASRATDSRRS